MILDRIYGDGPVLLSQLDQPLDEANGVLEMNIPIDHAMADQQSSFQTFRKVDRRAAPVGFGITLRLVEDIRCVLLVVMGPIRHRPQRRTGGKDVRSGEHRHQGDKPTIASAIDPNALWIHAEPVHEVLRAVDLILKVLVAHVPVDGGPPIAAITRAAAVIDVEYNVAVIGEVIVEHVFPIITTPPLMNVLKIT